MAIPKTPSPKAKTQFVRGTWPPSPPPMYEQQAKAAKPVKNTRDYGKGERPGFGTTGLTGET